MKRIFTLCIGIICGFLFLNKKLSAQLEITMLNTAVTENFSGFDGSGFAPTPAAGQLNSNAWRVTGMSDGDGTFGGTHDSGDFARGQSTGEVTTGGVYSFDAGGGVTVLGVQPAGSDFAPGTITVQLLNNTGGTITELEVSYDIYVYNDQGRSSSFNFAHSADDITYTSIPAIDYTTPEVADGTPAWVSVARSTTITGINISAGETYFLQWQSDDVGGSGSRDEFGLTNLSITADGTTTSTPTLVAIPTTLSGFDYIESSGPSAEQSFELSGSDLDGTDVSVTAPTDFEVSTTSGSGFGTSLTLPTFDGTATAIFVRLASGLSEGTYSGDINITGGGATAITVDVSGDVTPAPTSPVSITSEPYTYTHDFTGFDGNSDPSDWTTENVADISNWQGSGTGTSTAGGKYSFGDTGSGATFEGSLGFLPSSSRAIHAIIEFTNNSGGQIDNFLISYTAEHWRSVLDGRNNGWAVSYSIDGGPTETLDDLTYVAPNDIATGGGPHGSETLTQVVLGANIADGSTITITFFGDNGTGGGSRQGVAIDDFEFTASNDANLPVEWLSFTAQKVEEQDAVQLDWSVAWEEFHDFYEVQHSADGVRWDAIGQVEKDNQPQNAEGRSPQKDYRFLHPYPETGLNLYRIRQVDLDGAEDYSIIQRVLVSGTTVDFSFAPNPARDRLYFSWPSDYQQTSVELELISMHGQTHTLYRGEAPGQLRLPSLAAGMYQLLVRDDSGTLLHHQRVVIQ